LFNVSVDDFEGNKLVVVGVAAANEEKRRISAIDNLGVWKQPQSAKKAAREVEILGK